MLRSEVPELHFIAHLGNLSSIVELGILSHNKMRQFPHEDIANRDVQELRSRRYVPGGRSLWDYANLYFDARNPMMYVRRARHAELCVIRVSADVLGLSGVVISDQNAARTLTRFSPVEQGLRLLNRDEVYAYSWNHNDPIEKDRLKGVRCAEVLVPDRVPPHFITGACVSCIASKNFAELTAGRLDVTILERLFFR